MHAQQVMQNIEKSEWCTCTPENQEEHEKTLKGLPPKAK